jgi:diguanylate cyclase (GGDEF)-like protein
VPPERGDADLRSGFVPQAPEDAAAEAHGRARRGATPRPRVLIADDDRASRRRLQTLVEMWGYEPELAENGAQAIRALASPDAPRLAIIDWMMPRIDGLKVCQYVRQVAADDVYVIVLAGRSSLDAAVGALRAGADDYVTKPFHEQELELRLRAGRRIVELEEGLRFAAKQDPLTGIWSRAAIHAYLAQQLSKARREGSSVSALLIDLDHFKHINDSHGHATGDGVLREVAQRMRRTLRSYDGLGRVGGEEFLVVLPNSDLAGGLAVAERIRRATAEAAVETPAGTVPVTCSIGVASGLGGETTADALVERADQALYRAKRAGRNRVASEAEPEPD